MKSSKICHHIIPVNEKSAQRKQRNRWEEASSLGPQVRLFSLT